MGNFVNCRSKQVLHRGLHALPNSPAVGRAPLLPAMVDPEVTPLAVGHWLMLGFLAGMGPEEP